MATRGEFRRDLWRQRPLVALVLLLGLVDLFLLAAAAGLAEPRRSEAELQASLRSINRQIDQLRGEAQKAAFPQALEVDEVGLAVAALAARNNLQFTSFSSNTTPRSLVGKEYNVLDAGIEVQGSLPNIVRFLEQVQTSLISTLQLSGANLRKEADTWILGVSILVYSQR